MSGVRIKPQGDLLDKLSSLTDNAMLDDKTYKNVTISFGKLVNRHIGFFERRSSAFKQKNSAIWEAFRNALVERYGNAAVRMANVDFKGLSARGAKITTAEIRKIREDIHFAHLEQSPTYFTSDILESSKAFPRNTIVKIESHGIVSENDENSTEVNTKTWLKLRHALEERYSIEAVANCLIDFNKHINEGTPLPASFVSEAYRAVKREQDAIGYRLAVDSTQSFLNLVDKVHNPTHQIILDDHARLITLSQAEVKGLNSQPSSLESNIKISDLNRANTRTWLQFKRILTKEFSEVGVSKCGIDFDKYISKGQALTTTMVRSVIADVAKAHSLYANHDSLSTSLLLQVSDYPNKEAWLSLKEALEQRFGKNIFSLMKLSFRDIIESDAKFNQRNISIVVARAYRAHTQQHATLTLNDYIAQIRRMNPNDGMIISDSGFLIDDKNRQAIHPVFVNEQTWKSFRKALISSYSSDAIRNIGIDFDKLEAKGTKLTAATAREIINKTAQEQLLIGAKIPASTFLQTANNTSHNAWLSIDITGTLISSTSSMGNSLKTDNARLWLKFRSSLIDQYSYKAISKLDIHFDKYLKKGIPPTAGMICALSSMAQKLGELYSVNDDLSEILDIAFLFDEPNNFSPIIHKSSREYINDYQSLYNESAKVWPKLAQNLKARFGDDIEKKIGLHIDRLTSNNVPLTPLAVINIIFRAYRAYKLENANLTLDDFRNQAAKLKPRDAIILSDTGTLMGDDILIDLDPKQANARTWIHFRKALEAQFSKDAVLGIRVNFDKLIANGTKLTPKLVNEIIAKTSKEKLIEPQYYEAKKIYDDSWLYIIGEDESNQHEYMLQNFGSDKSSKKTINARMWIWFQKSLEQRFSPQDAAAVEATIKKHILSGKTFYVKDALPLTHIVIAENNIRRTIESPKPFLDFAMEQGRKPTDAILVDDNGTIRDTYQKNSVVSKKQANLRSWQYFYRTLEAEYTNDVIIKSNLNLQALIRNNVPLTVSQVLHVHKTLESYKESLAATLQPSTAAVSTTPTDSSHASTIASTKVTSTVSSITSSPKLVQSTSSYQHVPLVSKPVKTVSHAQTPTTTTNSTGTVSTGTANTSTTAQATTTTSPTRSEAAAQRIQELAELKQKVEKKLHDSGIVALGASPWPPAGFDAIKFDERLGPDLIQGSDNTCFMLSVFRGMIESEAGRRELENRVAQQGDQYLLRLTHDKQDYIVTLTPADIERVSVRGRSHSIDVLVGAMAKFLECTNPGGTRDAQYTFGRTWIAENVANALGWTNRAVINDYLPSEDALRKEILGEVSNPATAPFPAARLREYREALQNASDPEEAFTIINHYRNDTYHLHLRAGLEHILQNKNYIIVYAENRHYVQLKQDHASRDSVIIGNSLVRATGDYGPLSDLTSHKGMTTYQVPLQRLADDYARKRLSATEHYHMGNAGEGVEISVFEKM